MTPRIVARMLAFGVIAAYMALGPFYRQGLGNRTWLVQNWVMFSYASLDVCEVRFHLTDGTPIDRYAVLGIDPWYSAKPSIRKLGSVEDIERQARSLCAKLGPGTDLRANARCARATGWRPVMSGEADLCRRRRREQGG